ncbi:hypothetical protein VNO77_04667 [Canavalia gladiata]|uniref:Uncharacterized protein n=1 Tax=Canavalia gladiata TaxID=3824 RepID=A0AAN9MXQ4_CANGL
MALLTGLKVEEWRNCRITQLRQGLKNQPPPVEASDKLEGSYLLLPTINNLTTNLLSFPFHENKAILHVCIVHQVIQNFKPKACQHYELFSYIYNKKIEN